MNKIMKSWEFLQEHSLTWLQPKAKEQIKILPPLVPQPDPNLKRQPQERRTLQVFQALDKASEEDVKTYTDLIDYVRKTTGTGCSKKLVSRWKKERGLAATVGEPEELNHQVAEPSQIQTSCEQVKTKPLIPQAQTKILVWLSKLTVGAAVGLSVFLNGQPFPNAYSDAQTPTDSQTSPSAPSTGKSNSPKVLKFSLTLSSPKDLKVRQGDKVAAGEVLADRVEERSRLTAQRQALDLEYQQLQLRTIPTPPPPVSVPTVKSLPPISYAEEEAAIRAATMNVQQAERAFQLQQQSLKQSPLEESSAVTKAVVEVENAQRLVNNQKRTIDAVALLKNLPDSVALHEQEVLKQKEAELKQAQADHDQAQAKLRAASQAEIGRLQQLGVALEKTRAEQQIAIAKLQTKKDQRGYTEYEASVTAARRAEEQNQTDNNYSRQLQEAEQQRRDRSFQLAQLQTKIDEVEKQLRALSVVTSPYSGAIKNVKIQRQTNNELAVELTLAVTDSSTATSSGTDSNDSPASNQPSTGSTPISSN